MQISLLVSVGAIDPIVAEKDDRLKSCSDGKPYMAEVSLSEILLRMVLNSSGNRYRRNPLRRKNIMSSPE